MNGGDLPSRRSQEGTGDETALQVIMGQVDELSRGH